MPPAFDRLADAAAWFEAWLVQAALPLWSTAGVDAARGSFQEALSLEGEPVARVRRSRVQSRQVWVFATVARAGWGPGYAATAKRAFAFYLDHYRRSDALFAFSADASGEIVDTTSSLYEQAFSLLAMSAMHNLVGGCAERARDTREALDALRHSTGGWREAGERPFQANAHMHLFEAALAWEDAGDESWAPVADEIAQLALDRFIDPDTGVLREFFDADWRPLTDEAGGLVEPGHQFEWAWLLDRWGRRRGEGRAVAAAAGLFQHGLAGVDPVREVAVGSVWRGGGVRDPVARLWSQTEHLRAALTFGTEDQALVAARGLAKFLDTPALGVWRDKLQADGTFVVEPAPATSLYHLLAGLRPLFDRAA